MPNASSARRWMPLFVGAFGFFIVMAGATVPTPLYPIYSETYGFSPLIVSVIFAAYSAGVVGALLGTGPWSDEIGRKPLLLGGLVAAILAGLCFLFAQGMTLLLIARVLQGISVGIFTSTATIAVAEMAPKGGERAGDLASTIANVGGLGSGPILGAILVVLLPAPLRAPYIVHLALVGIALAAMFFVPEPGSRKDDPSLRPQGLAMPEGLRDLFVPAAISAFGGFMICGYLGAVAPAFLGQVLGFEGWHILIGFVAGAIFLTSCIGQVAEGHVPDRHVLPLGMGILTVGVALITLAAWVETLWGLTAAIMFTGIGHGLAFKGGLSALTRAAPKGMGSQVTATYFTVAYVAISIPVVIIGALQGPFGLAAVTVGYGIVSTVLSGLAFLLILRRDSSDG